MLDSDLKEQVHSRTLSYRSALEQQAQYQSAPNLMNLFMLVNHTFQTVQKMEEKPLEFAQFELEYLYLFIQQLDVVIGYYRELLIQLNQTQEHKLIELAKIQNQQ